ncbi:tyrosine-type recombinase/integrase [Desulfocurvibacter africanus]|uniref:tyrosine-type recombinase/integrase n=1 Tax=Desulfocurvibacter africanus TaxID=873 RepID=UPI000685FB21|nr:site-specific integrase [Desulfocurvibacter africanus]
MPSLVLKRGKRRWRASVMVDGQCRKKWFTDDSKDSQRAAATWEAEAKAQLKRECSQASTACPSLYEWGERYMDHVSTYKAEKTYVEKRIELHKFLGAVPKGIAAANYSSVPADVFGAARGEAEAYLQEQAKSRSPNAANKARKNLAAGWDWARKHLPGWPMVENPFRLVERVPEVRMPRYVPPREHVEAVDEYLRRECASGDPARVQDWVMFGVFRWLMARKGEVHRMSPADVNLVGGMVRLWSRKTRTGDMEGKWVPMIQPLRERMLLWDRERPIKDKQNLFLVLDTFKFCEAHYGNPFTSRQHVMERWCERAGVKPAFDHHSIRHRGAIDLYESGARISTIQRILRHERPTTTERYLESLGVDLAATREALERTFGGGKVIHLARVAEAK